MAKITITISDNPDDVLEVFFNTQIIEESEEETVSTAYLYAMAIQRIVDSREINNVINAIVFEKTQELENKGTE